MNDSSDIYSISVGAGLFGWFLNLGGKSEDDSRQEMYLSVLCIFPLLLFLFAPKHPQKISGLSEGSAKEECLTLCPPAIFPPLPFHFLEHNISTRVISPHKWKSR